MEHISPIAEDSNPNNKEDVTHSLTKLDYVECLSAHD